MRKKVGMSYTIITESCCDLSRELVEGTGIKILPMQFILGGEEYKHGIDTFIPVNTSKSTLKDITDFYDRMANGDKTSTAAANIMDVRDIMEEELKEGKDILYIGFSSALSSTFQTVNIVADELREEYADRQIEIVDSKCASIGLGLIAYFAYEQKNLGKTLVENKEYIESQIQHICHDVIVDDLQYLKNGGRISATTAIAGNLLNVKPILRITEEGTIEVATKVRGRIKGIKHLATKFTENRADKGYHNTIFLGHANCIKDAEKLKEQLLETDNDLDIRILNIGPIIGSHVGPGTMCIIYNGRGR